ncbi:MAG: Rpp14/Pop5 family protein [Nanoarchaeota archaeon]
MKLKKPPSLRNRKRYIIFKVHSDENLTFDNVKDAIMNSVLNWIGERGAAQANIWVIKNLWDGKKQSGYMQCSHKTVDEVKTALALIHQIGDHEVLFQTLKVTGTIKSGKNKEK